MLCTWTVFASFRWCRVWPSTAGEVWHDTGTMALCKHAQMKAVRSLTGTLSTISVSTTFASPSSRLHVGFDSAHSAGSGSREDGGAKQRRAEALTPWAKPEAFARAGPSEKFLW